MVAVGEFEILLGVLFFLTSGFTAWLWRHEIWFRNRVFPVIQVLTGEGPSGRDPDPTNDGKFRETERRLKHVEELAEESNETATEAVEVAKETRDDVRTLSETVENLSRSQAEHQRENERLLRAVLGQSGNGAEFDLDRVADGRVYAEERDEGAEDCVND